jgi:GAF domain-containing protein
MTVIPQAGSLGMNDDPQNSVPRPDDHDALARAQMTIAQQAEEIQQLRSQMVDAEYVQELRQALELAFVTGIIASPVTYTRLLEMIVETATKVIAAEASALFLLDEETQELTCEVVSGGGGPGLKTFRLPVGHGIVGYVAATGQPLAIADAESDARRATHISESLGFTPHSILCVPMFYNDQVIGVLELCDKRDDAAFTLEDTESLSLFANLVAVAIEMSRAQRNTASLIERMLGSVGGRGDDQNDTFRQDAHDLSQYFAEDVLYRQALDLALLVQEIAQQGENELKACESILRSFINYLRLRPAPVNMWGSMR